jgi:hypothetical protein
MKIKIFIENIYLPFNMPPFDSAAWGSSTITHTLQAMALPTRSL